MKSFEEELLDRFFLGPGSQEPIRSVVVSDEDLLDIFQVNDIDAAKRDFIRKLPSPTSLARILAGDWAPPQRADRQPDFVRILLFLCWMQVSKIRPRGKRVFRDILEGHLGRHYVNLSGLNALWDNLASFLKSRHNIELLLPHTMPHPQIGRTLRIAFPTWRDRALLRKLCFRLNSNDLLNPFVVAGKIATEGNAAIVAPSFQHYFQLWSEARLAGDPDAHLSPFWRAWLGVVSEVSGNDHLELEVSEYGEVLLYAVSPDDRATPISDPAKALHRVSDKLRKSIRRGHIYMEPLGFGRFKSIEQSSSRTLLVTAQAVADAAPGSILSMRPVSPEWSLATFAGATLGQRPQSEPIPAGLRWSGGIHLGGAYLGRTPLTPILEFSSPPKVEINGSPLALDIKGGEARLPDGVYEGKVTAFSGTATKSISLIENAIEASPDRISKLSPDQEISEDGRLAETWPAGSMDHRLWTGKRTPMAIEMTAIAEALYARSVRKLAVGAAFEIVSRGLESTPTPPSAWDVLRAFVDAGWLDMTVLRNVTAKQLVQRQLAVHSLGATKGLVVGPTPLSVLERLNRAAEAAGIKIELQLSASAYGLPMYHLHAQEQGAMDEFLRRANLSMAADDKPKSTLAKAADDVSLGGYSCVAALNSVSGYFDPAHTPDHDGLYRYEHSSGTSRPIYVSYRSGRVFTYGTLSVALLCHLSGDATFTFSGNLLRSPFRRVRLPMAWARWLALANSANAGPVNFGETWVYAYPADVRTVHSLSSVIPINDVDLGPPKWVLHAVNSRGADLKNLFVGKSLTNRRYGGILK